jgi:hypothetical protein
VQVCVGERDRFAGFWKRRKVGVESIYERRQAWTVLPYHHGLSYSDYSRPGIYVVDDGTITGSLSNFPIAPRGNVKQVTDALRTTSSRAQR